MIDVTVITKRDIAYNAYTSSVGIDVFLIWIRTVMSEALNQFLAEQQNKAFRMAQFAIGNADDAHDIVQDAMIKLVNKYANHDPIEWPPLFHRIMQHQISSWYRRNQLQRRWFPWLKKSSEDDTSSIIDYAEDSAGRSPAEILENDQAMAKLEQAMALLPLRQKQAFLCRCLQGLSTNETADAMACSTGSVKMHYHRALTTLRKQLGEVWP